MALFKILPVCVEDVRSGPEFPVLPVEMWSTILRFLDPESLMTAVKANPVWLTVCRGDPILRRAIRKKIKMDDRRRKEEIVNPRLLTSITRQSSELFGAVSNGTKTVVHHRPTARIDRGIHRQFLAKDDLGTKYQQKKSGGKIKTTVSNKTRTEPYEI